MVSGYVRDRIVFFEEVQTIASEPEVQVGVRVEVDEQGGEVSGEMSKRLTPEVFVLSTSVVTAERGRRPRSVNPPLVSRRRKKESQAGWRKDICLDDGDWV